MCVCVFTVTTNIPQYRRSTLILTSLPSASAQMPPILPAKDSGIVTVAIQLVSDSTTRLKSVSSRNIRPFFTIVKPGYVRSAYTCTPST